MGLIKCDRIATTNRTIKQLWHSKLHNMDILGLFCFGDGHKGDFLNNISAKILHRKENKCIVNGKSEQIKK